MVGFKCGFLETPSWRCGIVVEDVGGWRVTEWVSVWSGGVEVGDGEMGVWCLVCGVWGLG